MALGLLAGLLSLALATPPAQTASSSIWESIEVDKGAQLSRDEIDAVEELAEERFAEQRFLGSGPLARQPDLRLYTDPVGALKVDPLHLDQVAPGEFDIPVVVNPWVKKWMRYFLGSGNKWFARYQSRRSAYEPMMLELLSEAGMPRDLLFLSMIESGFSNQARSYASAVGLWQFMAPTGRAYGLRIDYWADQRVDPEAATRAAISYLKDLYELQGDWYLAWASYNAGPGRVNRAIQRHGTRNFWVLAEQDTLHEETRNYVPKILAAAILGKHPERYGFDQLEPLPELVYQSVEVQGAVTLDVIARCAGVTEARIEALNPSLLRGSTPPEGTTMVHLPLGTAETFAARFEDIPPSERVSYHRHQVARGESLGGIAAHYGVSAADIAKVNRVHDPDRIYVGMELVIPMHGVDPGLVQQVAGPPAATTVHTVRSGDTLAAVATRYGVTMAQLVEWNGLASADHIRVGQELTIHGGRPDKTTQLTYTVQPGDTVSGVAERFGVTSSQVMEWNGIQDASKLRVGRTLKLYGPSQDWKFVTVRSGDSLGRIAQAQGCTVSELKGWNDLSSSTIYPGQKLRVRED